MRPCGSTLRASKQQRLHSSDRPHNTAMASLALELNCPDITQLDSGSDLCSHAHHYPSTCSDGIITQNRDLGHSNFVDRSCACGLLGDCVGALHHKRRLALCTEIVDTKRRLRAGAEVWMEYLNRACLEHLSAEAFQGRQPYPWVEMQNSLTPEGQEALRAALPPVEAGFDRQVGRASRVRAGAARPLPAALPARCKSRAGMGAVHRGTERAGVPGLPAPGVGAP